MSKKNNNQRYITMSFDVAHQLRKDDISDNALNKQFNNKEVSRGERENIFK